MRKNVTLIMQLTTGVVLFWELYLQFAIKLIQNGNV